jgi:hypothetical protein
MCYGALWCGVLWCVVEKIAMLYCDVLRYGLLFYVVL